MADSTDFLELLPSAVYTTDALGRITFYNQAAAELWGHRPEIGTAQWCGSWRLYWPDGRPMAHDECPMAVTLREGRPVRGAEAIAERPDGTRVRFAPYPTPLTDAAGRVIGAINLLVDITEQSRTELESAKLAAIVTASDDAVISKTIDGRITSWNAAATRLLGYEANEIIGQPILRIIPPELHDEEKDIIARLRSGEYIKHYETVRIAKDGRRVELSLSLSPLRDKFGTLPLTTSRSSLVSLPHFCCALPLNSFQLPSTRSQFIGSLLAQFGAWKTRFNQKSSRRAWLTVPAKICLSRRNNFRKQAFTTQSTIGSSNPATCPAVARCCTPKEEPSLDHALRPCTSSARSRPCPSSGRGRGTVQEEARGKSGGIASQRGLSGQ
jgi:PAS domain S-box-containing protein